MRTEQGLLMIATAILITGWAACDEDDGPTDSGTDAADAAELPGDPGMDLADGTGEMPGDAAGDVANDATMPKDPATAPRATIDRFSAEAATLFVRTATNGLPEAGQAIDFDTGEPFITRGLGPSGQLVAYYNFDVQPTTPAPIYVLFEEGADTPIAGQLNIVDAIPGEAGYNDFWQITRVTVPAGYVANTITSLAEIQAAGYAMETTPTLVNCPVVPDGSTAALRIGEGPEDLQMGWYKGQVVFYFTFEEAPLAAAAGSVPTSPIHVTFNINPDQAGGGPGSGFVMEPGSAQTHNVVATLPGDGAYSPLWEVNVYDNADFDTVSDLATALAATNLAMGVADVNCPVVQISGP